MTQREQIEKIKSDFQASLDKNSPKYRRAIIRELDFLYRKYGNNDLNSFISIVEKNFDIPGQAKALIINELRDSQNVVGDLWNEYFSENTELFAIMDQNDFEKMQALYKVDFSKIKSNAGNIITEEIRRTARAGKGYDVLRSRLLKRSLGAGEASTLANTALAQFDNAMMFEFAAQAGIEKFKYDGVLHINTRLFCREHLGKNYAIAQIKKMDNLQGLPVETSCGGYNCTHFWTPVLTETKGKRPAKVVSGELTETQQYFKDQVNKRLKINMPLNFYKADFNKQIELDITRGHNAYWSEAEEKIVVGKDRFNSEITKSFVVAHEGAHARHDTKQLITKYGPMNGKVEEAYRSQMEEIFGTRGGNMTSDRKYEIRNKLDSSRIDEFRKLRPDITLQDIHELYSSMNDFFGAMSVNEVGFGHRTSYYKNSRWQMFEWFAHCSENYYVGNPYFEHYFPKEYKLTLQFMKEIEDAGI